MKTLEFRKLTLKNFLSVGPTPLELKFEEGLNLITGYDRDSPEEKNGIGKSSICDGVFFALFNETIKDLKMGEIVNDKSKKDCSVSIEFMIDNDGTETEYEIVRTLKPSNCTLKVNGEDKTPSSIPKTNLEISRILGISKDLFRQSIIMSIGTSISFFKQAKVDKRKFIEGIFNLEIFSDMLSDSRSGYNESKKAKEVSQSHLTNEQSRLVQYQDKHKTFETTKLEYITLLKSQIKNDIDKIKELKVSLRDELNIDVFNAKISEINSKILKVDGIRMKVEVKLSEINESMKKLKREIEECPDSCESCGRAYEDMDMRLSMNIEREATSTELANQRVVVLGQKVKVDQKKKELNDQRDDLKVELSTAKSILDSNRTINSHITTIKNNCLQNKEKILNKNSEVSEFEALVVEVEAQVVDLTEEYKELFRENKIFDFCKFILSEEGAKSVIVNKLKTLLNHKINSYLDKLGSTVTCEFDEYFSETIYNKNGVGKSYGAFSGGESKRIDLAILLTFQDILRSQTGINVKLAFYDEILDSSIDEKGIKTILNILKDKSEEGIFTYVISHRGKMSDLIDNEIVLEKHNDYTFLKEIK